MERIEPVETSLTTEITLKSDHLSYVHAALTKAGWDVEGEPEWVTTDDGYDAEVKLRVTFRVLLDDIRAAPVMESPSARDARAVASLLVA